MTDVRGQKTENIGIRKSEKLEGGKMRRSEGERKAGLRADNTGRRQPEK
jgi:hypothetical protein